MASIPEESLQLPESLKQRLLAFRRQVWTVKMLEAMAGGLIGLFVGYVLVFVLDRFFDTPASLRWAIWGGAVLGCGLVPWALHRWVWRRRKLDQLARLLVREQPEIGDPLLGIIELAENRSEQSRSPQLVEAAIRQVAERAEQCDLARSIPRPRHRQRLVWASGLAGLIVLAGLFTAAAASNAWARYLTPWKETPRYTFAAMRPVPQRLVVPHGEPFQVSMDLEETTAWKPQAARFRLEGLGNIPAQREGNSYRFEVPAQIQPGRARLQAGDFLGQTLIDPLPRPELTALQAIVTLPDYLQRPEPVTEAIRGGRFTAVRGSQVAVQATASRELAWAKANEQELQPQGALLETPTFPLQEASELRLHWSDAHGLSGREAYQLQLHVSEDAPPSLQAEGLPRRRVLLDQEVLSFQVRCRDDFGVKRVGYEWRSLDEASLHPTQGERLIGAGNPEAVQLELAATFSAKREKIAPQPIELRLFVEDYLPNRPRVYSAPSVLFVLDPDQHAAWVAHELSRWQRQALEVRDRELQLYETNKQLRALSTTVLASEESQNRLRQQAAAEKTNARRLDGLIHNGDELLQQAMKNPEIGVGHLEQWAELMQALQDVSSRRMPSVADLLNDAARQPGKPGQQQSPEQKMAGQNRNTQQGQGAESDEKPEALPRGVPSIVDIESSRNEIPAADKKPSASESNPRLTLPNTLLAGNKPSKSDDKDEAEQQDRAVDQAVKEQRDLLAEFDRLADELNEVLSNLEGSTLVKRLKAASREQEQVAHKLGTLVPDLIGKPDNRDPEPERKLGGLSTVVQRSSDNVSHIMDDMSAFFERTRLVRFRDVLEEMREEQVVRSLAQLSQEMQKTTGLAISETEYWSETLDRWAENLVEASNCGACTGCKSKGSLPPSIVLEVLLILQEEIGLREQTRMVEQSRAALEPQAHTEQAEDLAETQAGLRVRIQDVRDRILELPDAEEDFGNELQLLSQVGEVMDETVAILRRPETGSPAIAAETEVIELLLQSKRFNPNGGGGGGATPGGGGGGEANTPALALVGRGANEREVREERGVSESVSHSGPVLPEEFRSGLDEYFRQIEKP